MLPSWGLSNAAATLVGQNLGAGQTGAGGDVGLARHAVQRGIPVGDRSSCASSFAGIDRRRGSRTDPQVAPIATRGLRIISAGFPFYAAGYVLTQSFNGAGDTVTPTLINLGCFWAFEIPLAYVLGRPLGLRPGRRVLGDGHRVFGDVGGERGCCSGAGAGS